MLFSTGQKLSLRPLLEPNELIKAEQVYNTVFTAYQMPLHHFDFHSLECSCHILSISFQGGKLLSVSPKAADYSMAKDVKDNEIKRDLGCDSL